MPIAEQAVDAACSIRVHAVDDTIWGTFSPVRSFPDIPDRTKSVGIAYGPSIVRLNNTVHDGDQQAVLRKEYLDIMRKLAYLLVCSALSAQAQMTAVTTDGRRVMLNPDGTWKALDQAGDSSAVETNCNGLMIYGKDATGKPIISSDLMLVSYDGGSTGFGLVLEGGAKRGYNTLHLTAAGAKACVKKYAKVKITFQDGSSELVASDAFVNCKGDVPIHMGGTFGRMRLMTELGQKQVRSIRISLGDEFMERELTQANSLTLMYSARCLMQ